MTYQTSPTHGHRRLTQTNDNLPLKEPAPSLFSRIGDAFNRAPDHQKIAMIGGAYVGCWFVGHVITKMFSSDVDDQNDSEEIDHREATWNVFFDFIAKPIFGFVANSLAIHAWAKCIAFKQLYARANSAKRE